MNSDNSGLINNPNLRPQKTTEYELGFKQVLTEKTALKISAYYREMRDLLQTVSYTEAYPITYIAYGNRDFGTVKGFTLEYEVLQ
ncbi:MAG: TonB-dependent receptor [Owenweeksia sp.]|nr:TonB-dependent receptor [Owenweeksia sp.]